MGRLALAATLLALLASPAAADPVSLGALVISAAAAAGVANAAAIGVALGISATAAAVGAVATGALASLGLQYAFAPRAPRPPDIIRELGRAQSLPPHRFAYGRSKVYGSPAPFIVQDDKLYGCLILNSRPSHGGAIDIRVDKRPQTLTGDILDFDGSGAAPSEGALVGHAQFWLGLGDQSGPPAEILAEAPDIFDAADAWSGQTVLWVRLLAGGSRSRLDRWPRVPPDIEVVADWSKLWDPRDPAQDPDDPDTWGFSRCRALVALDALMRNPARPYPLRQIDLPSFIAAASGDDEAVALAAGGTEPRWRADGVVAWSGLEIEEQVAPIAAAGASGLVRIGGKVALAPGTWSEPEVTVSDLIGTEMTFEVWRPGRDLATTVNCRFASPDRDYEMADLAPWRDPDADPDDVEIATELELAFVTSPTQAMRCQKIAGKRQGLQRRLSATLPPSAIRLVASSRATLALPAPWTRINGVYEVQAIAPVTTIAGDGVAMRCPAELVETSADVFAWDPATDEQAIVDGVAVTAERAAVSPPSGLLLTTGASAALDTGDAVTPRILARWTPSPSARAIGHEIEFRVSAGDWQSGGAVDGEVLDGDGRGFGYISPAAAGSVYDVRVRAAAPGSVSTWISDSIEAAGPEVTLNAPTGGDATGGAGQIAVSFVAPNDADFLAIEFWGADSDDSGAASLIAGPIYGPANAAYGFTETGLGTSVTRYYFARSVGPFGATSAYSASASDTTDA